MESRRCAFLTMENREGYFVCDALAFEPLARLGWIAEEVAWTSPDACWGDYDAVVIRSTWDYQTQPDAFLEKLAVIEASGARLLNPLSVCRWNLDKVYLRDLESRGVPIVPTQWPEKLDKATLASLFQLLDSEQIVVKPLISAGAKNTFLVRHQEFIAGLGQSSDALNVFQQTPLMAQPFLDAVVSEGEFSLFFFAGEYSHAVIKRPRDGDFRVQQQHGGTMKNTQATEPMLLVARMAINAIGQTLLYARVDLVRLNDGSLAVIELELLEPSLYFDCDPESATRFAISLNRIMSSS